VRRPLKGWAGKETALTDALSIHQPPVGVTGPALQAVNEALAIYDSLNQRCPNVHAHDLWRTCHVLAYILDGLGRDSEAAQLRRRLGKSSETQVE